MWRWSTRCAIPGSLSHLTLVDTGGDSRWSQHNAAEVLARRGYSPQKVELVRRWFTGEFASRQPPLILMRIGGAYYSRPSLSLVARGLIRGEWRSKMWPEALIFAGRHLLNGWIVVDRLSEITVPTLVIAGRDDFIFPPDHQRELGVAIPARACRSSSAGPQPYAEQPAEVMHAVGLFISGSPDFYQTSTYPADVVDLGRAARGRRAACEQRRWRWGSASPPALAGCRPGSMYCASEVEALPARLRHWAELCQ